MFGRSFRIARIASIPVGISPWWLLIVALFTWVLGDSYYPSAVPGIAPLTSYGLGLLSVLLLFASVLAHEFGHALVARRRGIEVLEIDLWLLGGVSRMKGQPRTPGDEARYAAAGPAVTAVIAVVFGAAVLLVPASAPAILKALLAYQLYANTALLLFNIVPAFPLDGGRIVRAAIWWRRGDLAAATNAAAAIGRVFGWMMVCLGVLLWLDGLIDGLVLTMVGGFIVMMAGAEQAQEQMRAALLGVGVRELMSTPAITIDARSTLPQAQLRFERYRCPVFAVTDADGLTLGLLSLEQLERTAKQDQSAELVGELADRDPELLVDEHEDVVNVIDRAAFARVGRAVVLDASRRPLGIVSITDVQRAVRITALRGASPPPKQLAHHR